VKQNWFFKPTVPDKLHSTLDILGYGPYSSITYKKPDFEDISQEDVDTFFSTQVEGWIKSKTCKWGNKLSKEKVIKESDYYLVLGQCGGDSVVTQYDFGHYFTKLEQVVKELTRVGNRPVVVKLHPYTDGEGANDTTFSVSIKQKLEAISPKVKVYLGKINIHSFIEKAYCVFLANSGAGFEVMMHHKPMITWGYPEYHWVTYDLRHLADIHMAIRLDWFDKDKQDKFLYWYMEKYCFYNQETSDRRVQEMLNSIPENTFDDLWRMARPSQTYDEFKSFISFAQTSMNGHNPVVVEVGVRNGNQRPFYKELLKADYIGIDIDKKNGSDFIQGDSSKIRTLEILKKRLAGRKIDILFIDGDHSYEGVKRDWELYSPLASIVAFHDIVTPNPVNQGVCRFWDEISENKKIIEFKHYVDGIGVILNGELDA
jgi:hypothetical protein